MRYIRQITNICIGYAAAPCAKKEPSSRRGEKLFKLTVPVIRKDR